MIIKSDADFMTFDEALVLDLDVFFNIDEFAETAQYVQGQVQQEVRLVAEIGENLATGENVLQHEAVFYVRADEVTPSYNDKITTLNEVWRVVQVFATFKNVYVLLVKRDLRGKFT